MSIAVIDHTALMNFTEALGFPKKTKVRLVPEGKGYQLYDQWIRDNVQWISQIDFDATKYVRITEFANLVGEIPEPLFMQQYLEGDSEYNAFKTIEGAETHVNRAAIQFLVTQSEIKYKVDYVLDTQGAVETENWLAVAVYDSAEDTTLTYASNLKVEQLWTTRLQNPTSDQPLLQKRAYAHDPKLENSYEWIDVGFLQEKDLELWRLYNAPEKTALERFDANTLRKNVTQ